MGRLCFELSAKSFRFSNFAFRGTSSGVPGYNPLKTSMNEHIDDLPSGESVSVIN